MTLLHALAASPASKALGWTLLHLTWEGAVIALGLTLALLLVRTSRARYAVGCAGLGLLLAAFALTFTYLLGQDRGYLRPSVILLSFATNTASSFGGKPSAIQATDFSGWVSALWMAGVSIFYIRAFGGWLAVRRLRRIGVCAAGEFWEAKLAALRIRLEVSQPVLLLQSSLADVPVVIGYLRPVILIPAGLLTGMPVHQIEFILMHELVHVLRHDYLVNLVQTLAEGLLFYHPAVWWISGLIRTERENCCDDVVARIGNARDYAAALTALEENRQSARNPAPPDSVLAVTGGNLVKRIQRLLKQPERPRAALTLFVSVAAIVLSAGLALAYQEATGLQARSGGTANTLVTPWDKWLQEDVAYIITDQERAAFRRLTDDPEREMFVQQFWQRRDPTPGTAQNEFKEEHYRRIGYANQHFGSQQLQGWKSDRGRIYITHGPPDEIDSHPSGGRYTRPSEQGGGETTVNPFEQWRFKFIEGIGKNVVMEFVDAAQSGDFRMTMDPHDKERIPAK